MYYFKRYMKTPHSAEKHGNCDLKNIISLFSNINENQLSVNFKVNEYFFF